MSLLRARCAGFRNSYLLVVLCAVGCTDDLDPAGYPGAVCYQPWPDQDPWFEREFVENDLDEHGHRVVEGDILVADGSARNAADLAYASGDATSQTKSSVSRSLRPWPLGIVPYTFDSTLPELQRDAFQTAIAEFEARTELRFVERSLANKALYPNFVRVVLVESKQFAGRSFVGVRGGEQDLELTVEASVHSVLHELGHAIGLLHEHQRHDRDQYVTLHLEHIEPDSRRWLEVIEDDGIDVGDYDFESVMHYYLFDGRLRWTIEPKLKLVSSPCGVGLPWSLSPGDVAAISGLYPSLNLAKHSDLNGDGTRDLLARTIGEAAIKLLPEREHGADWKTVRPSDTLDWEVTGSGDFSGDGADDLLWTLPNGELRVFDMKKSTLDTAALVDSSHTPRHGFQVVGIDDFDGDGKHELLTMNESGKLALVFPATNQEIELPLAPLGWRVAATGDLDGDHKADIVWQPNPGQTAVWFGNDLQVIQRATPVSHESGWWIAGIDDFDGDGRNDIVWTSALAGVALWWNDGGPIGITKTRQPRGFGSFAVVEAGDFDGDGIADLLWANDYGSVGLQLFAPIRDDPPRLIDLPEAHNAPGRLLN